jgi:hypothetical protein
LLGDIRSSIETARQQVTRIVDATMGALYWHVGKRIREEIMGGQTTSQATVVQQRNLFVPEVEAALVETKALGTCDGFRPWLGPRTREQCGEPNRLLIRTASNAYFPQVMRVISDLAWEFVEEVENLEDRKYERKKAKVKAALEGITDEEVFQEILSRRGAVLGEVKSVKQAELETLIASKAELGNDLPDGNFFARAIPREKWDAPWTKPIARVVAVHRLREVMALAGFTRFEPMAPDIEGELEMSVRVAALAREITWLPADR